MPASPPRGRIGPGGPAACAHLLAQRTDVRGGGGGTHGIIRHTRGHADLGGAGDLDRERRSVDQNLTEGPRVLLHALPSASQADLEASTECDVEGARHRGKSRRRPEGRIQHRPESGSGRVEPREDERSPRLEPGTATSGSRIVGNPQRIDSGAIAHLRDLAHPTRRVPRVEDDAEAGEPSRRGEGWPETTHALDSTKLPPRRKLPTRC